MYSIMKQRIIIPILLFVAAIGTSCVSQHKVERNYSEFRPNIVRLNLTMDDYQYLGDVTIDVEYKTYLGIFRKILTVNGEPYDPRFYTNTDIAFGRKVKLGLLNKALYKVTATYPDADYLVPVSFNDIVEHMPAGRIHKCSLSVKAYAINQVSSKEMEELHKAEVEELNSANAELKQELEAAQQELKSAKRELEKAQQEAARLSNQRNNNRTTRR